MESEDFLRVITEFEFICEDIGELQEQIDLTKSEVQKILQAISSIENAKKILSDLFPKIESLNNDVREDLAAEFADMGWFGMGILSRSVILADRLNDPEINQTYSIQHINPKVVDLSAFAILE